MVFQSKYSIPIKKNDISLLESFKISSNKDSNSSENKDCVGFRHDSYAYGKRVRKTGLIEFECESLLNYVCEVSTKGF